MALSCQKNSFLKELKTVVTSCEAREISVGHKEKISGYEVILEDSILFPEGGGQPDDRGTINDVQIIRVFRRRAQAVHFVPIPFDPGTDVLVRVDWKRRFDHMQQHSGQHLVTCIAEFLFTYSTTSWSLGEKTSFIELDVPSVSKDQLVELECVVNEKIRDCVPMYPKYYDSLDDPELKQIRSRGLPDDHSGPVRLMVIEGLDYNTCCGTHVSNLAQLQVIKLLGVEKGKKNKVNLTFVAGDRVLDYLGKVVETEKRLTGLLKGGPDQHVELVDKLQKALKVSQKNALTLLRDVAVMTAREFKSRPSKVLILHRREADNEFMNIVVNEIGDESVLIFLTTGDENGSGMFLLAGPEKAVGELGPRVAELLDGKGAGKRGKYQGKANRLCRRPDVEKLLVTYSADNS